ncbi:hypothetical protein VNO77_33749 [Canavalia gladiata]|uniref:Uncharacterized protein n=1 Tax=Canavalia gladiata TaxID=3824 RepID=A0AAN9PYM7_CANGL
MQGCWEYMGRFSGRSGCFQEMGACFVEVKETLYEGLCTRNAYQVKGLRLGFARYPLTRGQAWHPLGIGQERDRMFDPQVLKNAKAVSTLYGSRPYLRVLTNHRCFLSFLGLFLDAKGESSL